MQIIHILKDGTELRDISGHVVKIEDAEPLYHLMETIEIHREVTR